MTDDAGYDDRGYSAEAEASHHSLVRLHALAGTLNGVDPDDIPGLRPASPGVMLRNVAEAPLDEVPVSARVGVLYDLAKADFPHYDSHQKEYRSLAASVADARGIDADQLLDDLKQAAQGDTPLQQTASGQALPHHETAFIGEDVCTTKSVTVGTLRATWVFSEFETNAAFDDVVGWIDPRNWPKRGPTMFKGMSIVGGVDPTPINTLSNDHWHGVFHEQVQIVRRMDTLLHCDYWRDTHAAGMTYDLALSLDSQLDVDRGFLLVVDTGPVRRVKALKVVGFTTDVWDDVARMVCPFWTDWVRAAVEGGTSSSPSTPTSDPATSPTGTPTGDWMGDWLEFFTDASRTYIDMATDVTSRASSGGYQASDWLDDARAYWTQLAKDWSTAWTYGLESLDELSKQGMEAGFPPPGKPRETARGMASAMASAAAGATAGAAGGAPAASPSSESTIVPVPGLATGQSPRVTRLESIEAGGATIEGSDITVTVTPLPDGTPGVQVTASNAIVPPGLYVGTIESADQQPLASVQLYLSRAEAPSQ